MNRLRKSLQKQKSSTSTVGAPSTNINGSTASGNGTSNINAITTRPENSVAIRPVLATLPSRRPAPATYRSQSVVPSYHTPSTQSISILQPRSTAEQYWAARALSAETLLAARVEHHRELRTLTSVHDDRREQDKAMHEARYARLEALVLTLLGTLLLLALALPYLNAPRVAATPRARVPAHFTIPILSPFTSVVEHETSAVGFKAIAVGILALTLLAYALFRHWISRQR
ncbi:hypothetical protein C8J57DRAFT_1091480 [Mycena rebaudengoi]|nr:hypothetical protein C8J57DRAFT_1091480 [Mycena rebaudengoi]